ncbi:TAR DNA-binding protein 43-like [Ruditapes philippinarum]|uniref:TAR DNA-binding protein 43-like n=1 Tax=Ruditapes philippinarum TaxID=129788 RepID=UPI00295B332B|nr:TAR DNA-binding protein 43-like [Ruditapes philippinarum]
MMSKYIQVAEDENEESMEVPLEEDGTLLLSTLNAQFPGSCGLKYRNPESGAMRGIRLSDGRLYPPDNEWSNRMYVAVFPKEGNKKKEDLAELSSAAALRIKRDRSIKCSDLIVLGLPWKSVEDDLKKYFSQFGELLMVQVKKDPKTSHSKGFGFIRFADYDAQVKCMAQRHHIDGRWCDVRIPNSKVEAKDNLVNRKVFVGRCTEEMTAEDLRSYFNKFGEVVDVFIPRPFRAFAFVTFSDPEIAQALCGEDHIIKGASVHISNAAPKTYDKQQMDTRKGSLNQQAYSQGGYTHTPWSQGGGRGAAQPHIQGQVPPGVPNNMGMSLGAFQLNPAMIAAAQAMLSGQGGWGPVGMVNQPGGPTPVSGGTPLPPPVPTAVEAQTAQPTQQPQPPQSFGSIGSNQVSTGTVVSAGNNSFLGWGGNQGQEVPPHQSTSPGVGGWGAAPPKQGGGAWS